MGVMSCYRENCPQIMCETYIDSVGYICYECKNEFKEYLSRQKINPKTEVEIIEQLKIFMETRKGYYTQGNEITIGDFFNKNS